ncbi:MAG: prephenate dehydrogenase [Verrucomicrobia bacterium]|jgi:prephenate dehydrogenase|nr:MAG: prephenate dehydrogenase [Verrucomicrobiota bacterium]MDH4469579.1 prephenate dehydrogenase/arogenate dehydrogenase family protein [Verrucomicrobiae bacterium]
MRFGIIGFGRLGQCWSELLLPYGKVMAHDAILKTSLIKGVSLVPLEELRDTEVLLLAVPISSFQECCKHVAKIISPSTLLVDTCSVKVFPMQIMSELFPQKQPIMAIHPLFGPNSILKSEGTRGHKIVLCTSPQEERAHKMIEIFQHMGLEIISLTPEEHDMQSASMQALVHFIGRAPMLTTPPGILSTPSFELLQKMVRSVTADSEELFGDMHRYNPYTHSVREKFLKELSILHHTLT